MLEPLAHFGAPASFWSFSFSFAVLRSFLFILAAPHARHLLAAEGVVNRAAQGSNLESVFFLAENPHHAGEVDAVDGATKLVKLSKFGLEFPGLQAITSVASQLRLAGARARAIASQATAMTRS